jgi:hypothetical protein
MNRNQFRQADMEFVDIPGTAIRVSRIALGTWAIGGWMWGGSDESDAIRAIHAALDRAFNLIRDPVGPEFMAPPDRLAA